MPNIEIPAAFYLLLAALEDPDPHQYTHILAPPSLSLAILLASNLEGWGVVVYTNLPVYSTKTCNSSTVQVQHYNICMSEWLKHMRDPNPTFQFFLVIVR